MVDIFTKKKRSTIMAAIKGRNNKTTEIAVIKSLKNTKANYKLHDKNVFGTPDISNEKKKVAVFLDGCFWHGCKKCRSVPKQNRAFWKSKIEYNKRRRRLIKRKLKKERWKVLEFWEHEINKNPNKVASEIVAELRSH